MAYRFLPCIVFLGLAAILGVGLVDDSYIFLRYGQHVSMGLGPVFNVGERVEGYTSPLWLALISSLFLVMSDPAMLAMYVSAACGLGTIALVGRRSVIGALAIGMNPGVVYWAFSGMDTALFGLCLTAAVYAITSSHLSRRACMAGGVAFAAACLTRLEAIALLPVLLAWVLFRARERNESAVALAGLFMAPLTALAVHLLWRWSYYGALVPNTAAAKVGVGQTVRLAQGLAYLPDLLLMIGPPLLVALLGGTRRAVLAASLACVWTIYVVLVGGDFLAFVRFGAPMVPVLAVLTVSDHWRQLTSQAVPIVLALQTSLLLVIYQEEGRTEIAMAAAWAETGKELRKRLPENSYVATLVAGAVPYYSQRPTIDLLGLTDAHIAREGLIAPDAYIGHQRYDSRYVLSRKPKVIVLHDSGRYDRPRFASKEWPHYVGNELRYVYALADLVDQEDARARYVYRADPLRKGGYLEALWLR